MTDTDRILEFWFGKEPEGLRGREQKLWFGKDPNTDWEIREKFLDDYQAAAVGLLDGWRDTPRGCLALILLLDQFPRNMFRGTPRAFATDGAAVAAAEHAVESGIDLELPPRQRVFIYMPFEHSEDLTHQQRCVDLMSSMAGYPEVAAMVPYAARHREIIARFGRFPHRNAILGRESTPEEIRFLATPGSSF